MAARLSDGLRVPPPAHGSTLIGWSVTMVLHKRPGVRSDRVKEIEGEFPVHIAQNPIHATIRCSRFQQKLHRVAPAGRRRDQGDGASAFTDVDRDMLIGAIHNAFNPSGPGEANDPHHRREEPTAQLPRGCPGIVHPGRHTRVMAARRLRACARSVIRSQPSDCCTI